MYVLVTGAAGFIGFHLASLLIESGVSVIGIDNLNSYYDPELKKKRLEILLNKAEKITNKFLFFRCDLQDRNSLDSIFKKYKPKYVVNLAAQAGVRYSIENPSAYISSNLNGFFNIIDLSKNYEVSHFVYASTSSVYGGNQKLPFSEEDNVNHPVSLYAATKKSNELIAHSYSHLHNLSTTGLRFFTVYGPWGRPDMALFLFTKAILKGEAINIFNNGNMSRDFTYISDIVNCLKKIIFKPSIPNNNFNKINPDPSSSWAPYKIYNIGNSNSISLMDYIYALEQELGMISNKNFMKMQDGDVISTQACTNKLEKFIDYSPSTTIKEGIRLFVKWYKSYYKII